jgi:hypothetical protein
MDCVSLQKFTEYYRRGLELVGEIDFPKESFLRVWKFNPQTSADNILRVLTQEEADLLYMDYSLSMAVFHQVGSLESRVSGRADYPGWLFLKFMAGLVGFALKALILCALVEFRHDKRLKIPRSVVRIELVGEVLCFAAAQIVTAEEISSVAARSASDLLAKKHVAQQETFADINLWNWNTDKETIQ